MGVTPPFPPRHRGEIPVTELLAKASRSLLEVWGEEMFRGPGTVLEVLGQRLIILRRRAWPAGTFGPVRSRRNENHG